MTTDELRREQKRIFQAAILAFFVTTLALVGSFIMIPSFLPATADESETRLVFLAGANLAIVCSVMVGVGLVSRGRRNSTEDIMGSAFSSPSPKIAIKVAFLQNTLEQAAIMLVVLGALVLIWKDTALPFVAAATVVYSLGRIFLYVGYPKAQAHVLSEWR